MKTIQGNLIHLANAGHFDVIVHGCNCFCAMGKGIALSIKLEYPAAYAADCDTARGDPSKLGSFSQASVSRGPHTVTVVNAYTQYDYCGPQPNVNYAAIRQAFRAIKQRFSGSRIGYPKIGAGLARGDWAVIAAIIDEELSGEDHTFVNYQH